MEYRKFRIWARKLNAIGSWSTFQGIVRGESNDAMIPALYEKFEHIQNIEFSPATRKEYIESLKNPQNNTCG